MKQAYLILAHKNPEQLSKLITELLDKDTYVLVHIDKKCEISLFYSYFKQNTQNLWICEDRIEVNWAGFSQIRATLNLIKLLFDLSLPVEYVHLLSGQDFPIKPNKTIRSFFQENLRNNFINCHSVPNRSWDKLRGGLDNIEYFWEVDRVGHDTAVRQVTEQKKEKRKRKFLKRINPFCGSQWWSLHVDCIDYLHKICVPGNEIYDFYENTYVPDEMFFQTVLMNSFFKDTIVSNNYRYIYWDKEIGHPTILVKNDYFKLIESDKMFARKFDNNVDSSILDYLCIYKNKVLSNF